MIILGFTSIASVWEIALLTGVSFVVGVLGGFVGLALGTMRLPVLLLLGFPASVSAGTNILVSTLSAAVGSVGHIKGGRVDWRVVWIMGMPAVIGAFIGGFASDLLPYSLLLGLAGVFVLWQGIEFLLRGRDAELSGRPPAERFTTTRVAAEGGIGFSVGLLGGAVGLILGSIRLPAIIRVLGIHPRVAAGTNLFIGFLLGTSGFLGHGISGDVDVPLMVFMGSAAMVGSFYGARLTGRVRLSALIVVMGLVLVGVGVLLIANAAFRAA